MKIKFVTYRRLLFVVFQRYTQFKSTFFNLQTTTNLL